MCSIARSYSFLVGTDGGLHLGVTCLGALQVQEGTAQPHGSERSGAPALTRLALWAMAKLAEPWPAACMP